MDDEELERLAREEILRETQRASARAEQVGPQGWKKCPVQPANKRFLRNTIMSSLAPRPLQKRAYQDWNTEHRKTNCYSDSSKSFTTESRHRRNNSKVERSSGSSVNAVRRKDATGTIESVELGVRDGTSNSRQSSSCDGKTTHKSCARAKNNEQETK